MRGFCLRFVLLLLSCVSLELTFAGRLLAGAAVWQNPAPEQNSPEFNGDFVTQSGGAGQRAGTKPISPVRRTWGMGTDSGHQRGPAFAKPSPSAK
jgi:hypothetical protein